MAKLHYFDTKGLGEVARLIFAISGTEFEDVRYNDKTWPENKEKMLMGVLPVLEIKEGKFGQSAAICRYLAREHNLYGKSNLDAFRIDEVCETMKDLFMDLVPIYMEKDQAKKDGLIDETVKNKLPRYLVFLERRLSENEEGKGWFVGKDINLADLVVYNGLNLTKGMVTEEKFSPLLDDKPNLKAHSVRVSSHEKVAAWEKAHP